MQKCPTRNDMEWLFFDVAKINVKGGDGGDGCKAMRREFRVQFGGPCGGNGGKGGDVYLECSKKLNTLSSLQRLIHHKGQDGKNGRGSSRHGEKGEDCIVEVPPGTIVRDENGILAGELKHDKERMLVARGGKGGRGNEHFRSPRNRAPEFAEKGGMGKCRWLSLELKLLADVGLVGVPNAGKSTLLAATTNAKPKIASYPFTTVVPNLGVCNIDGTGGGYESELVLADIPGLLEGAHAGRGLGHAFLRHIQRCKAIIHLVSGDSLDPVGDFLAINQELCLFSPQLATKPQIVVINKIDLPNVRQTMRSLAADLQFHAGHGRVVAVSAITRENVVNLMHRVRLFARQLPEIEDVLENETTSLFDFGEDESFEVHSDPLRRSFEIVGESIENIVQMTNWDYHQAVERFQRILEARGINDALRLRGAVEGDTVVIGGKEFSFHEARNSGMRAFAKKVADSSNGAEQS